MVYMLYVPETNTVDDVDKGPFQLAYSNCVVEICQMTNPPVASAGLSGTVNIVGVGQNLMISFIFTEAVAPYLLFWRAGKQSG